MFFHWERCRLNVLFCVLATIISIASKTFITFQPEKILVRDFKIGSYLKYYSLLELNQTVINGNKYG